MTVKLEKQLMAEFQNQLMPKYSCNGAPSAALLASSQPATTGMAPGLMLTSLMKGQKRKGHQISTKCCYWESLASELCTDTKASVYLVTDPSDDTMVSFPAVFTRGGTCASKLATGNNGDDSGLVLTSLLERQKRKGHRFRQSDWESLASKLCTATKAFVYLVTDPSDGTIVSFHPAVFTSGVVVIASLQPATTERIPDSVLASFMKGQRKGHQIATEWCYWETLASALCTANKAPVKLQNHLMGESSERQNQLMAKASCNGAPSGAVLVSLQPSTTGMIPSSVLTSLMKGQKRKRHQISTKWFYWETLGSELYTPRQASVYKVTGPSDGTVSFHPAVFTSGVLVLASLQPATTGMTASSVLGSLMKRQKRKRHKISTECCYWESLVKELCTAFKASVYLVTNLSDGSMVSFHPAVFSSGVLAVLASSQPATTEVTTDSVVTSLMKGQRMGHQIVTEWCYCETLASTSCTATKDSLDLVSDLSDGIMVYFHPAVFASSKTGPDVLELPRSPWIKPSRSIHVRSLQEQIQRPYGLAGIDISSMPMLIGPGGTIMIPTAIQQLIHLERVISIIDIKVNQNEEQPTQETTVGEILLRYGTSWAWLASEVHDRYQAAQGGQQLQEVQGRLNPYNCWPGRSVSYVGIGRVTLFWPYNNWADVQVNLNRIVLRGGWIE